MNDISPFDFSKKSFDEQRNISFCYVEGKWEQISISDIERYKKINPQDWQLARLNSINHKYFVAIQTIARQEERYLKEWIEHHLNLGIDFIYIYDNNDEDGLDDFLKNVLTEDACNKIEVIPWHEPMELQQFAALEDCISKHKFDIKWLLTIDVDEFLALEMPLKDFLMEFEDASEIFLSWESFNANGQLYYEDKPVMERFTETFYCKDAGGQGKIFFRPTRLLHWGIHSTSLTKGKTVNVLHKEIVAPQPFANIYQKAWIKHYFTKSLEEWNDKIRRGCCDSFACRKYSLFFDANPKMKKYYDPNAQSIQNHSLDPKENKKESKENET